MKWYEKTSRVEIVKCKICGKKFDIKSAKSTDKCPIGHAERQMTQEEKESKERTTQRR